MKFKTFQLDDYSRLALVPGAVLGHDTGLGKGIAAFTIPLLWLGWHDAAPPIVPKGRILLVIPGGLHRRMIKEARSKFGINLTLLPDQKTFLDLTKNGSQPLPEGFYMTSYTQLCRNGVTKFERPRDYKLSIPDDVSGIGAFDRTKTICCVHQPTLADLACRSFDVVAIDEGVRMKGADSLVGKGIRRMQPPFRLVLTATPIKNRLQDVFFLLAWVADAPGRGASTSVRIPGEPSPRFPYRCDTESQRDFAKTFQVVERNLSKEANAKAEGSPRRYKKLTAEVCNVHGLWKLCGNLILRRRKQDCGEPIVKKLRQVIRVPMGTEQARVYQYQLLTRHYDLNNDPTVLPRLQSLRVAAANPCSKLLDAAELSRNGMQLGQDIVKLSRLPYRSSNPYTPKLAAQLAIAEQCLSRGEQVLFFSSFQDGLDILAEYLRQAGVRFHIADGRISEQKRGVISEQFENQEFPILLANLDSMAEGNNFWRCRNVVNSAFHWAWDLFEQGINRVHRLPSPEDVNVYNIICEGTIDRRLEELISEKGDSQELVLDGKLITEPAAELNLADLLDDAIKEFRQHVNTIDEGQLSTEWEAQRQRLRSVAAEWLPRVPGSSVQIPTNVIPLPPAPPAVPHIPTPKKPEKIPAQPVWRQRFLAIA
jgi:hypothetical protein